jgi:hypothetical protein
MPWASTGRASMAVIRSDKPVGCGNIRGWCVLVGIGLLVACAVAGTWCVTLRSPLQVLHEREGPLAEDRWERWAFVIELRDGRIAISSWWLVRKIPAPLRLAELRHSGVYVPRVETKWNYPSADSIAGETAYPKVHHLGVSYVSGTGGWKAGRPRDLDGVSSWTLGIAFRTALAVVVCPLAFAVVVFSRRVRARRRQMLSGLCDNCGYDLRVTVGQCPECGTPMCRVTPANDSAL